MIVLRETCDNIQKKRSMKKLEIYDFDGVLFKHPSTIITEMIFDGEISEDLSFRISMEGGLFTEEMIKDPSILPIYESFKERYFSQRMSREGIERLKERRNDNILTIASLNLKDPIVKLLKTSNIFDFFKQILSAEDSRDKKWMLRELGRGYDPKNDITFITDTIYDIQTARECFPYIKIKAVQGTEFKRSLLGFVQEEDLIAPFY